MEKIKWLLAIVCGFISALAEQYALILLFVAVIIVLDIVTGIVKCKVTGEALSSSKANKGFWKKLSLFVGLFFGFFLDYFIPYAVAQIGFTLPFECALFGMIIGCYIVINESISICENLYASNSEILPKWIVKLLISAKEQLEKKEDNKEEEKK